MDKIHFLGLIFMVGTLLVGDLWAKNGDNPHQPLVVILMGPPGAGKGTHATSLSQSLSLPHISTGDLFRETIRNQTPVGKKAKRYLDEGRLVPDGVVLEMVFDRLSKGDAKEGFILDGFPRTLAQAKALDQKLHVTHQIVALHLSVPESVLIERITGRIMCKQCGRPYHKKYDPPQKEGVCNHCGGSLYQRDDDTEEVFRKRLEVYKKETEPLLSYYRRQKGILREINGGTSKEQVFQEVLKALPIPVSQTCGV